MPVQLLAAGSNAHGQLAIGTTDDAHVFTRCRFSTPPPDSARVLAVACGANHTLLLLGTSDGTLNILWGTGDGSRGQLGGLTESSVFAPLELPPSVYGLNPILIAAAWETSYIALRGPESDMLISFGGNDFGDLGRPPHADTHVVPLGQSFRISALAAGSHHVVALLDRVALRCAVAWGASRHGQLGVRDAVVASPRVLREAPSTSDERIVSAVCGSQHTLLLRADGRVEGLGSDRKGQLARVPGLTGVRSIGCTWNTSYAISSDSDIHASGSGNHGQLAASISASPEYNYIHLEQTTVQLACGSEHVLVLACDGAVWGWGWNEHGNLGLAHTHDVLEATKILTPESSSAQGIWCGCGTSWLALS